MSTVGIAFAVLWMLVGFLILRFIAIRIFPGTGRAELAALGVVVAFAAGAVWPFSERLGQRVSAPGASQVIVAPTASVAAEPSVMHDVSRRCRGPIRFMPGGAGSVDGIRVAGDPNVLLTGAVMAVKRGFTLSGWAASMSHDRPASAVCLVIDGRFDTRAAITYGGRRPDVASAFHAPGMLASAFVVVMPPDAVSRGRHRIEVSVLSRDEPSQGKVFNLIPGARVVDFR